MEMAAVAEDAARRVAKLAEAQRRAAEVVEAANEAANDAAAVRIEAKAKAGELLQQMAEGGGRSSGHTFQESQRATPAPTLDELGVSKSESSRWQQVANVPEDVREDYVEETKAAKGEVTTAGLLRHGGARTGARGRPPLHHPMAPRDPITDEPLEAAPAINGYDRFEQVWNLIFEIHRVYGILAGTPDYVGVPDQLEDFERDDLLGAVRDIVGWLGGLQAQLEEWNAGHEQGDQSETGEES
jgi:hypothetical protein